ncbi:MAG: transglycosylase domain-containing protein [Steroidobacteraceae bacterium]
MSGASTSRPAGCSGYALDDISPALVEAVVAGEDRRFWQHAGVDWRGVAAALRDTWLRDRRRGASTITMQLAELLPAEPRACGDRPGVVAQDRADAHRTRSRGALDEAADPGGLPEPAGLPR